MSARINAGITRGRVLTIAALTTISCLFAMTAMASAAEPVANDVFAGTNDTTPVVVTFNASDADNDPITYSIVDPPSGGTLGPVDGNQVTYTADADFAGVDSFTYRATANGEQADANATVVVRPQTVIDSGPTGLTNDNTPTWDFSSPQSGVSFECSLDNAAFSSCSSPYTPPTLSDGAHNFRVRARIGGTVDPTPASRSITVDATQAEVAVVQDPGQADPTNNPEIRFALLSNEALVGDSIDESDFDVTNGTIDSLEKNGDNTVTIINVTATAEGDVEIAPSGTFGVEDIAENTTTTAGGLDRTVEYDATNPVVVIDSAPADGNLDAFAAIEFSSADDPDATYECRTYETSAAPEDIPAFASCDSPYTTPFLNKNVSYTFDVRVTDDAGNVSDVDSATWLQSNTAPVVPAPEVTLEAGTSITIELGSTDADDDSLTYSIVGGVSGGSISDLDTSTGDLTFTADNDAVGIYTFDFSASDERQGGTTFGTVTVRVQPQTVIDTRPNDETNDTTPTWTFSSPSGVNTFLCSIDGDTPVNCNGGTFTAPELDEGSHDFEVSAVAGSLVDPTPATDTVIIDLTTPDVSITSNPDAISNDANPAFEFESTDGTATFECSVDPADSEDPPSFESCESGDTFGPLTDGDYVFSVRSTDPGGNVSDVVTYEWEVDLILPTIVLDEGANGPREGKFTNAKKPQWFFSSADKNLDTDKIRCRVDAQTWLEPCLSPFQQPTNLNDGAHTLHIEAEDVAGNLRAFSLNFTVDTLAPSALLDSTPSSPSGPSADFEFSASTPLGPDGKFECRTSLNGGPAGAWDTCTSPLHLTGLSSGTRKLEVRAVDSAGNASSGAGIASHTWTTIGGAPDTVITQSNKNGGTAAFGFNSPGNPLATFECKIDAGAFGACTSPKSYTGLSVGSHTFSVRATNQVGTTDASPATSTWSVGAPTAPDTDITRKPSATTTATAATLEFASSDAVATFECSLDDAAFTACESPKSYSGLALGTHTFKVRAVSDGLNDASPASTSWKIEEPITNTDPPPVCNEIAESPVVTKSARIAKGLLASATVSHREARVGQDVAVTLNGNVKKLKKLAKKLKNVTVISGGQVVTTLRGKSWANTFTVTKSQANNLTLKFVRKKGKAIKKPAAFTVKPACVQ